MEISWTNRVRNTVVLRRIKVERIILGTVKRRKANWIGNVLYMNFYFKIRYWRKDISHGKTRKKT